MTQKRRLFDKFKQNPRNVKYDEFATLLEACGYTLRKGGVGSHRWFSPPKGCPPIHFPEHRPVGEVYIKKALRILEECCNLDEDD